VTTRTSQPNRARYFAVFQVRTHAGAFSGGNGWARNKSLGRAVIN